MTTRVGLRARGLLALTKVRLGSAYGNSGDNAWPHKPQGWMVLESQKFERKRGRNGKAVQWDGGRRQVVLTIRRGDFHIQGQLCGKGTINRARDCQVGRRG